MFQDRHGGNIYQSFSTISQQPQKQVFLRLILLDPNFRHRSFPLVDASNLDLVVLCGIMNPMRMCERLMAIRCCAEETFLSQQPKATSHSHLDNQHCS